METTKEKLMGIVKESEEIILIGGITKISVSDSTKESLSIEGFLSAKYKNKHFQPLLIATIEGLLHLLKDNHISNYGENSISTTDDKSFSVVK